MGELAQLFEEHHARVYRVAYRITGNASDAEDVLQNVFLRLARREDEPDWSESPERYLYRAAINASLDILRSRKRHIDVAIEDAGLQTPAHGAALETQAWLREALARLNPKFAELFVLRFIEGYENHEIARMTGTSQAVIAVTMHRIRGKLRDDYRAFAGGGHNAQ